MFKNYGRVTMMSLAKARSFFFGKDFESTCILNGKKVGLLVVLPKEDKQLDLPTFVKICLQTRFNSYDLSKLKDADHDTLMTDRQADQIISLIKHSITVDHWYVVANTKGVALSLALALCRVKSWNEMRTLGEEKINGVPDQYVFFKLCKQAGIDCEFSRVLKILANRYKKDNPEDTEFAEPLSDKDEETLIDQIIQVNRGVAGDIA